MDRTCPECGASFTVDSAVSRRKHCSPVCREKGCAHLPEQRVCPQCNKEFNTDLSRKRKFCSAECLVEFRRSEEQGEARLCQVCDNPFQAPKTVRAVELGQKPLSIVVTAGRRGDSPQFEAVLEAIRVPRLGLGRPRGRPDRVGADKAYDSGKNRAYLRRRGIKTTIPVPLDRVRNRHKRGSYGGRRPKSDRGDHKQRHAVECGIDRLKRHRAVATRYGKLAVRHEATVLIAAINEWL